MSLGDWGKDRLQELQAKIVLLEILNDTPAQPFEKPLFQGSQESSCFTKSRILSLSREKELTETLAFIASATDDPGKVLALAIEEENSGQGMTIALAVNNGGLEYVRIGFEKIAQVLQKICDEGVASQSAQADLLQEIIALNHNRILCRLRSKHAVMKCNFKKEKSARPKTIPLLANTFTNVHAKSRAQVGPAATKAIRDHIEKLDRLFNRLEGLAKSQVISQQGQDIVSQLVTTSSELSSSSFFSSILDISNMEPSSRKSICKTIGKLGRYCTAARFLFQAAARYSIFSQIQISVIKLPIMTVPRTQDAETTMAKIMTELFEADEMEKANSQLTVLLNKRRVQHSQVCTAITSTRFVVHAEIQLLVHYELQSLVLPPRIICSNKKACFLCNLFLELHGKYIVPSTHGKFYEKWFLPEDLKKLGGEQATSMDSVLLKFRDLLDERLRREILVGNQRYPHSDESIAFVSAIWSEVREPSLEPVQRIDSGYEGGDKESVVSSTATIKPLVGAQAPYLMLTRGQTMSFELCPNTNLVRVSTPRIHLTISYSAWQESIASLLASTAPDPDMGCQLKLSWLEESEVLDPGSTVIDLGQFMGNFQETFNQSAGSCDFYVTKGRDIISVKTTYL